MAKHFVRIRVKSTVFWKKPPGRFLPGPFLFYEVPPSLFVLPGDNVLLKYKWSPQGALTEDITVGTSSPAAFALSTAVGLAPAFKAIVGLSGPCGVGARMEAFLVIYKHLEVEYGICEQDS